MKTSFFVFSKFVFVFFPFVSVLLIFIAYLAAKIVFVFLIKFIFCCWLFFHFFFSFIFYWLCLETKQKSHNYFFSKHPPKHPILPNFCIGQKSRTKRFQQFAAKLSDDYLVEWQLTNFSKKIWLIKNNFYCGMQSMNSLLFSTTQNRYRILWITWVLSQLMQGNRLSD